MSWKTRQHKSLVKKRTKLALAVLAVLVSLLLLSQIIQFISLLTRPLNSEISSKNYTWNGEFTLNFVTNTKPLSLVSFSPQDRKVTILTIPDATLVDVPGGFGKWQIRAIHQLGGENLVKSSVSQFLGIPVDGFSSHNLVDHFRGNLFSGMKILPELHSDLTGFELVRLKLGLLQVRFDRINQIDLEKLSVLEKQKLADGSEVFIVDPIRLDSVMSDLEDPKIKSENLSVAIFNATEYPLLAAKTKRLITNMGGNVIVTQNAPRKVEKSYVDFGSTVVEGEKSKTLDRLKQIFDLGCSKDPKCDKISVADLGLAASRAQIIVILGEDFK
ncbi:MAG: LCP family protein [Patescibacteria group bacterium]